ncbi:hypothetical protein K440DRAFT_541414 [Wilcoxina mikolae CBS 423.85]|nr:hypothetical protein K440DRAFT_541414 [Wilcoxina mikolae CBS 423.85]
MNPPFNDPSLHISHEDLSYIAHTQRTLSHHGGGGGGGGSPSSSRRPSTSSTHSGSASISLDPRALAQLSAHFDGLLAAITSRVENLSQQTLKATTAHHRRASSVADQATREIERLREILRQCDELQNEFLKIKRIGEIVKGFRTRVEVLEQRIGK